MMCKSLNSTLRTVLGRLHLSDTNWWRSGILSVMAIFRQLSRLSTLILADLAVTDRMGHRKHEQWQTSEGRLPCFRGLRLRRRAQTGSLSSASISLLRLSCRRSERS